MGPINVDEAMDLVRKVEVKINCRSGTRSTYGPYPKYLCIPHNLKPHLNYTTPISGHSHKNITYPVSRTYETNHLSDD